jgi:excisionase family DNA binding protein
MSDTGTLANLFSAMADIPARLAALERVVEENTKKVATLQAALPPNLVTVTEAASTCKVSVSTMRRWVKRGEVPIISVGHTVRVDLSRLHGKDASAISILAVEARAYCGTMNLPC